MEVLRREREEEEESAGFYALDSAGVAGFGQRVCLAISKQLWVMSGDAKTIHARQSECI
jgi:hypothetical protein